MGKFAHYRVNYVRLAAVLGMFILIFSSIGFALPPEKVSGTRAAGDSINLFWIGVNNTEHPEISMLDRELDVDENNYITFAGNHSGGWDKAVVEIRAWYDLGETGDDSEYPVESDATRNLAFRILYHGKTGEANLVFPDGDLELSLVDVDDIIVEHHTDEDQSIHQVQIELYLGPQIWTADGERFHESDPEYDDDPGISLMDPWSWDLEITLGDMDGTGAGAELYGEFGLFEYVSVSVNKHPSVTVEPGDYVKMDNCTLIRYASNGIYWVNVSTNNLHLNSNPGSSSIPVTNLSVMNVHPLADEINSKISEEPVLFEGENIGLVVWDKMMPAGNGTSTSGPWTTDYNSDNYSTMLEWWISVPRGTMPGIYWAAITITIDIGDGHPVILGPTRTNGVEVVDLTKPISHVTEANSQNVTAYAYDDETKVENVTLWYRFSEDNETWGNWTEFGTDQYSPWFWEHDSPEGEGYYEFYTLAKDAGNNTEEVPGTADMCLDASSSGIPGFGLEMVLAALAIALFARKIHYGL